MPAKSSTGGPVPIHAWVQEARCQVSVAAGLPQAGAEVARLARLAVSSCQPDFGIRANLHRAALRDPDAVKPATGVRGRP